MTLVTNTHSDVKMVLNTSWCPSRLFNCCLPPFWIQMHLYIGKNGKSSASCKRKEGNNFCLFSLAYTKLSWCPLRKRYDQGVWVPRKWESLWRNFKLPLTACTDEMCAVQWHFVHSASGLPYLVLPARKEDVIVGLKEKTNMPCSQLLLSGPTHPFWDLSKTMVFAVGSRGGTEEQSRMHSVPVHALVEWVREVKRGG